MSKKVVVLDSTMFSSLEQCALQFDLAFNRDLEPIAGNSAIEEGSLVHTIMEPYYESIKAGWPLEKARDFAIERGREAAMDFDLPMDETEEIIFNFREYTERWGNENFKILDVETPFAIQLYNSDELQVIYIGKIDLLVSTSKFPKLVIDHKKRRQNKPISMFSNQFIGYCIATGTQHMEVNSFGLQKTLSPTERFTRIPVSYPIEVQRRWIKNTIWWAGQYVYHEETGIWPTNWTSCDKFSGCQFKKICQSPMDESQEYVIKTQFKVRPEKWDPSKPLKEGKRKEKNIITLKEV